MADIWVSGFLVVARSKWTPEIKQEIGERVLNALYDQWNENQKLPDDDPDCSIEEFMRPNSNHNTTITVNTN